MYFIKGDKKECHLIGRFVEPQKPNFLGEYTYTLMNYFGQQTHQNYCRKNDFAKFEESIRERYDLHYFSIHT